MYEHSLFNKSFSKPVFWSWIAYAFLQGALILSLVFLFNQTINSQITPSGKTINFLTSGMMVYATCVITVNLVLLKMINNYTGFCEVMIVLEILSIWLVIYVESQVRYFDSLYGFWHEFTSSYSTLLGLALIVLTLFSLDYITRLFDLIRSGNKD